MKKSINKPQQHRATLLFASVCIWFFTQASLGEAVTELGEASIEGVDTPTDSLEVVTILTSDDCRIAVDRFPLQPEVCARALQGTADQLLQAELSSYLAIGYARTNQPTDAREAMDQALNIRPEHWLVHANHGVMSLYLKDFRAAYEATNRAMDLVEQPIPDLYLNLSLAARGAGEFSVSQEAYGIYLQLMGYAKPGPTSDRTKEPLGPYGPPDRRSLQQRTGGNPF